MSSELKQPIRLTQQRAEALLAVFDAGAASIAGVIRGALEYRDLRNEEEMRELKTLDVQLAAATDAAAIIRFRYLHGTEPTEPTPTLF